jgi:nucleoside-diphosphate-sugar epimerase
VQVGPGKNKVDIIYIDNAVEGHLLASDALDLQSPVAGKCYFLSDGNPVVLWDWIKELLQKMEVPPINKTISYQRAKQLGGILEWVYGALNIKSEPPMTRFLASQLATSHYFDISNARKDFNYAPIVDQEEGMNRLIRFLMAHPAY